MLHFKQFFLLVVLFFSLMILCNSNVLAAVTTCPKGEVCLTNPLGKDVTPAQFIGKVINGVLGVVGSLALVMFIYGGLTWMTSAGGAEKVKKGKDILIWAVIGLVIIFSAYALVNFVIFDVVQAPITPAAPAR